jgi:hypothetical protein
MMFYDAWQNQSVGGDRGTFSIILEVKVKGSLYRPKAQGGVEFSSTLSLNSALDGWMASTTPRSLYPGKGPVWIDVENLAPNGIRSPDRPDRSESLYRLRYPGPHYS